MLSQNSPLDNRLRANRPRPTSDNSFATARNLGTLNPGNTPVTFRASGTVDNRDRVDFYKFTIAPGANYPAVVSGFNIRGIKVRFTGFAQVGNQRRTQVGPQELPIGSWTLPRDTRGGASNPTAGPITAFIRIERVGRGTGRYSFRLEYQPS